MDLASASAAARRSSASGRRAPQTPPALTPGGSTRSFAGVVEAPRAARRFVAGTLRAIGADALVDDATLVVSELATNAVRHARGGFAVTVTAAPARVRIAVRDAGAGSGPPRLRARPAHGLGIVAAIASAWDTVPGPAGTLVWAELRR